MLNLHVVFAVDRAGLVGEDGETHHGIYDVGFLRHAPGLTVLAPASCAELKEMLHWAIEEQKGPVAIRYPRGGDGDYQENLWNPNATVITHRKGKSAAIVTYGRLVNNAIAAADVLAEQGVDISVIRLTSLAPIDFSGLENTLAGIRNVIVAEETSAGIHNEIAFALGQNYNVSCADLGCAYVTHGSVAQLYEKYGLDATSLANKVKEVLGK